MSFIGVVTCDIYFVPVPVFTCRYHQQKSITYLLSTHTLHNSSRWQEKLTITVYPKTVVLPLTQPAKTSVSSPPPTTTKIPIPHLPRGCSSNTLSTQPYPSDSSPLFYTSAPPSYVSYPINHTPSPLASSPSSPSSDKLSFSCTISSRVSFESGSGSSSESQGLRSPQIRRRRFLPGLCAALYKSLSISLLRFWRLVPRFSFVTIGTIPTVMFLGQRL